MIIFFVGIVHQRKFLFSLMFVCFSFFFFENMMLFMKQDRGKFMFCLISVRGWPVFLFLFRFVSEEKVGRKEKNEPRGTGAFQECTIPWYVFLVSILRDKYHSTYSSTKIYCREMHMHSCVRD